jgi:hypothetical protein
MTGTSWAFLFVTVLVWLKESYEREGHDPESCAAIREAAQKILPILHLAADFEDDAEAAEWNATMRETVSSIGTVIPEYFEDIARQLVHIDKR